MDFIRKLCDDAGLDVYEKASNVLEAGVTSLRALSKAQAKKLIDTLIAEKDGAK
jgi:F0F1-type ATP synthase delta subunit